MLPVTTDACLRSVDETERLELPFSVTAATITRFLLLEASTAAHRSGAAPACPVFRCFVFANSCSFRSIIICRMKPYLMAAHSPYQGSQLWAAPAHA